MRKRGVFTPFLLTFFNNTVFVITPLRKATFIGCFLLFFVLYNNKYRLMEFFLH